MKPPCKSLPVIHPKFWANYNSLKLIRDNHLGFQHFLKYRIFLPDTKLPIIFLNDSSLLILFCLDGIDYTSLSEEQREKKIDHLRYSIKLLSEDDVGFSLSNLTIRDTPKPMPLNYKDDAPPLIQFVGGKRQAFWDELFSKSFSNRILCSLRYRPVDWEDTFSGITFLDEEVIKRDAGLLKSVVEKLEQGFIKLSQGLKPFGFRQLTHEESFNELYRLVNFSEPPTYRPDLPLEKQIANSRIKFDLSGKCLVVNDTEYISVIGIKEPSSPTSAKYLQPFYNPGFPLMLWQTLRFASKDELIRVLDFDPSDSPALSEHHLTKPDHVDQAKNFRTWIENENELPASWSSFVLVRAGDKKTLYARQDTAIQLLEEIGFECVVEKDILQAGFLAMFPGHDCSYLRQHLIQTPDVGNLLNTHVPHPGDTNPVDYFQDQFHGVLAYNPFNCGERAHLSAVCGPADGRTKSFAIKDLISCLAVNPMVWVIDLSETYSDLFVQLKEEMPTDTAIMRVSTDDSDLCFNPFLLSDANSDVPKEQFEFCVGLLKIMVGPDISSAESEEAMREGLKAFFVACGIMLRNREVAKPIQPLRLLSEILEKKLQHSKLATAIRRWTMGQRGKVFNSGEDKLQSFRYCYFDLHGLEDEPEFRTAILYTIISKVHRNITDESLRMTQKYFVLDEAHRYIADPHLKTCFLKLINADGRLNIMLDITTQSLDDLKLNEIWANLEQAFFFSGLENIEDTFSRLQLDAYIIHSYPRLDSSSNEVIYWSNEGQWQFLWPVTDPHTYWLATTDAGERKMKRRMKELFGNIRDTIEELVRVTADCTTIEDRLSKLRTYFEKPEGNLDI
jgi:type IV secretory pathway VirB4 component